MTYQIINGDCLEAMHGMEADSVDAIVTDPPYGLEFMGKDWDHGCPGVAFWSEALRVAKPGAHLLAFGGSRTYHRMACAVEDAGWEVRDQIMWLYGSGFPKSLDVSKAIDKAAGAERPILDTIPDRWAGKGNVLQRAMQAPAESVDITAPATDAARTWQGWGTALKPAHEPIVVARKPLIGTVAANVQRWGTGAINVDGCRVGTNGTAGRWPANVCHDGSEEVVGLFPDRDGGAFPANQNTKSMMMASRGKRLSPARPMGDTGSAARFFYCAKASRSERNAGTDSNHHPTVKPVALMRWLCRLVTPPDGLVLDPFAGSGSTGIAALQEGLDFIGIERDAGYCDIARRRIGNAAQDLPLYQEATV